MSVLVAATLAAATLAAAALAPTLLPEEPLRRHAFEGRHMGTTFRIVVFAPDSATAADGVAAAFGVIAELDARLSDYDPSSELSRLGEVAGMGRGREVSPELGEVLAVARTWSERTDGAFDVTVGPVTQLWRWSARRGALPDSARLARARAAVGWRYLELAADRQTARLTRPGMALDVGGIAKGWAADAALAALARRGLTSALVDAGGDIAVGEAPPGEAGWRIAVDGMDTGDGAYGIAADSDGARRTLTLAGVGVATSGDAFRFFEADGVRYSHIVDPRTGLGVTGPRAVTVIAPDATTADVLASALAVLDEAAGRALVASVPGARIVEDTTRDTLAKEPST